MARKKVSVGVEIDGKAKGFKTAAGDAARASDKLKKRLNKDAKGINKGFQMAAKAMGLLFVTKKIVEYGGQLVKLAGQIQGVEKAFKKLGNPELLKDLRKATRGTVEDLKLMQYAVKADNFNIPLSKLATYFEFATNRAIETGQGVDYLVNSIIDGVGKKSTMILDNLGISLVAIQAETKKTGSFMDATGNIFERELAKMGDVADTADTRIVRLKTTWENFKGLLGKKLVESDFFDNFIGGIEKLQGLLQSDKINPYSALTASQAKAELDRLEAQKEYLRKENTRLADEQAVKGPNYSKDFRYTTATTRTGGQAMESVQLADHSKELQDNTQKLLKNAEAQQALQDVLDYHKQLEVEKQTALETEATNKLAEANRQAADSLARYLALKKAVKDLEGATTMAGGTKALHPMQLFDDTRESPLAAGMEWVGDLEGAFVSFFSATEQGFEGMAAAFGDAIKQMAAQLAAKAAIFGILNLLTMGTGGIALGAAKALGDFSFFASGGVVSGPTLGMVGEYPGAAHNPEVVAPLNTLQGMLGGEKGSIIAETMIAGNDLKVVLRRN